MCNPCLAHCIITFRIVSCLKRLHYFILCNSTPNYFIPEHNMIEGRFSEELRNQLAVFMEKKLNGNIFKVLLLSTSLTGLQHIKCYVPKQFQVLSEFDRTVMNLPSYRILGLNENRSLNFFIYRILNKNFPKSLKNI